MPESNQVVRAAAIATLGFRIAYGAGLVLAPVKLAGKRWLGPGAAAPAAQVPLRGMGAREIAVHGIALAALLRGDSVRPWLFASIAGDLADVAAAAIHRDGLPDGSAAATAAVAGGSAAVTGALAYLLD